LLTRVFQVLAALLAVVLVSAPVGAAGPLQPAAARKIAIGVSMLPYDNAATYDTFTAKTGKAPAVWSIWADWGGAANPSAFPTALVNKLTLAKTVPLIIWQPVGTGKPPGSPSSPPLQESCGVSYDKIIGGDWDTYIHSWAQAAAATTGPVLIRFAHEMDGNWFPYSTLNCGNSVKKFKRMWQYVVNIFRHDGATNVKFVWSPRSATTAQKALYPGDSYVDYVGVTAFNWAASKGKPWQSLTTLVSKATKGLTTYSSKPWIVAETGSVEQTGYSRPLWLKTGYAGLYSALPRVAIVMYFNVDMRLRAHNQPNWQLHTTADFKAYKAVLAQAKFQGKVTN
jgi:mannan endo-1,4-beta-mannosidase